MLTRNSASALLAALTEHGDHDEWGDLLAPFRMWHDHLQYMLDNAVFPLYSLNSTQWPFDPQPNRLVPDVDKDSLMIYARLHLLYSSLYLSSLISSLSTSKEIATYCDMLVKVRRLIEHLGD